MLAITVLVFVLMTGIFAKDITVLLTAKPETRMFSGVRAHIKSCKFHAQIIYNLRGKITITKGGIIISERFVLTTAATYDAHK